MSRCTLVMDATGVGAPVLDLLRQANLGCGIVLVMLEKKELALSMRVPSARVSRSGHLSFGTWREGEHDDVVMATALACWRARWRSEGIWGTKSLGIEY